MTTALTTQLPPLVKNQVVIEVQQKLPAAVAQEVDTVLPGKVQTEVQAQASLSRPTLVNELKTELRDMLYGSMKNDMFGELLEELKPKLLESLKPELLDTLLPPLRRELYSDMLSEMETELYNKLKPRLLSEIKTQLLQELPQQISDQILPSLSTRVENTVQPRLQISLKQILEPTIQSAIERNLEVSLRSSLGEQIKQDLEDELLVSLEPALIESALPNLQRRLKNPLKIDLQGELEKKITDSVLGQVDSQTQSSTSGFVSKTDLSSELTKLEGKLTQTESKLNTQISSKADQKDIFQLETSIKDDMQREHSALKRDLRNCATESELTEMGSRIDTLQINLSDKVNTLNNKVKDLETSLKTEIENTSNSTNTQQSQEFDKKLEPIKSEIESLKKEVEKAKTSNSPDLARQVTGLSSKLEQLETKLQQNKEAIAAAPRTVDLDQKITDAKTEFGENLATTKAELEALIKTATITAKNVDGEIKRVKDSLAKLEQGETEEGITLSSLQQELTKYSLKSEVAQVKETADNSWKWIDSNCEVFGSDRTGNAYTKLIQRSGLHLVDDVKKINKKISLFATQATLETLKKRVDQIQQKTEDLEGKTNATVNQSMVTTKEFSTLKSQVKNLESEITTYVKTEALGNIVGSFNTNSTNLQQKIEKKVDNVERSLQKVESDLYAFTAKETKDIRTVVNTVSNKVTENYNKINQVDNKAWKQAVTIEGKLEKKLDKEIYQINQSIKSVKSFVGL